MYKNIVFDVDGTLLDTLEDIKNAVNEALSISHYQKQYSYQEAKGLLGHGMRWLCTKALEGITNKEEEVISFEKTYFPLYQKHQGLSTKPFDGILSVLNSLKNQGCRLFILTNKPHPLLSVLVDKFFKGVFDDFLGVTSPELVKPKVEFSKTLFERNEIGLDETLYVGDSSVDVETAKTAKIDCCICRWGYDNYKNMDLSYCKYVIDKPKELLYKIMEK